MIQFSTTVCKFVQSVSVLCCVCVLYSKYHARPELRMAAVLLVQPYQPYGTIFQPQSLKQAVCLLSVVDSRHICSLLLSKTVVNCNVASASVSVDV